MFILIDNHCRVFDVTCRDVYNEMTMWCDAGLYQTTLDTLQGQAGDSPMFVHLDEPNADQVTSPTGSSLCNSEVVSSPFHRNGTVMSPHYPSVYSANIHCLVTLRPRSDAGERVQLVFIDFDLNYPIGNSRDPHEYVRRI